MQEPAWSNFPFDRERLPDFSTTVSSSFFFFCLLYKTFVLNVGMLRSHPALKLATTIMRVGPSLDRQDLCKHFCRGVAALL